MKELGERLSEEFADKEYAHAYAEEYGNLFIAAQIKALREQRGLTQAQLAESAGMKQERISALENVDYDAWTVKTLRKLARTFDAHLRVSFVPFSHAILDVVNFSRDRLTVIPREADLDRFRKHKIIRAGGGMESHRRAPSGVRQYDRAEQADRAHQGLASARRECQLMENSTPALLPYALRAIYLSGCTTRLGEDFDPLVPGQPLGAIFRTGESQVACREMTFADEAEQRLERGCVFTTRFEFAYTLNPEAALPSPESGLGSGIAAQISADITVDYRLNLDAFPPREELEKWARTSVMVHAWPYWREFCHSSMLRMNLPVTMIPLIQFADQPPPAPPRELAPATKRKARKPART